MKSEVVLDDLRAMLGENVAKLGAVGVMAVLDIPGRDRISVTVGSRDRASREPLTADLLYQAGSQTKTIVAMACLLLARDGRVRLDQPAVELLDLPIDERITLEHLITNSCGLGEFTVTAMAGRPGIRYAPRDLVALALPQGQLFEPGARFDYCNTGWVIAAMILDAHAPGGYVGYVRERIFAPLGMENSYLAATEPFPVERMAGGYLRDPTSGDIRHAGADVGLSWAYGAGDMVSNAEDLIRLYRSFVSASPIGLSLPVLTARAREPSEAPIFALSLGASYAYGLERRGWGGRPVWGHPGRTPGYSTSTWIEPRSGIVVATAFMNVADRGEREALANLRYNAGLIITQALMSAYRLAEGG